MQNLKAKGVENHGISVKEYVLKLVRNYLDCQKNLHY